MSKQEHLTNNANLWVQIQTQSFDLGEQYQLLCQHAKGTGAQVMFVGTVRDIAHEQDQQQAVQALTISHYEGMTQSFILDICQQAQSRWDLANIRVLHRIGQLEASEPIVFVGVASAHRSSAFAGAEFIIDQLKTQAPFWKKEHRGGQAHWLDMKQTDLAKSQRWNTSKQNTKTL